MRASRLFLCAVPYALCAFFLASCGPTYPKDQVTEAIVKLCREEYHTEIQATIRATTIGILIPMDGLFEIPSGASSEEDLRRLSEGLPFSKSALEKIEVASRALSRVVLSTDAPLEFYTVVARDIPTGVEFLWSGYITDLKRLNYLDISQGDFLRYRTPVVLRIQPERLGEKTIENFFRDLNSRTMVQILRRNVASAARVEEILASVLELRQEGRIGLGALKRAQRSVALAGGAQVVVHVAFPETPPDGPAGAYLFMVDTSDVKGLIRSIERLPHLQAIPARYSHLGPPETWGDRFQVEPFSLPQFLADQIARRARLDLAMAPQEAISLRDVAMEGTYRDRRFDFQFHALEAVKDSHELVLALVKSAAEVLHSYRFGDFETLSITDALRGTRWVVPAKELSLYRRRSPPTLRPLP